MVRQRTCKNCKKELTDRYYLIVGGVNGYKASRANFCYSCCNKQRRKNSLLKRLIERGDIKIIEKETGNKIDDEISEFEDKWEKHSKLNIQKKNLLDDKTLLNLIQKARQELEPYLQKPEIVEKAWEREYNNEIDMSFYYLFAKSAREKDYKQNVVQPTIEKILDRKLDQEINTITTGNHLGDPGIPGRADGNLKINGKLVGKYNWLDHTEDCRRLSLLFWGDNKLTLQVFLRALEIKEKELKGETKTTENGKSPSSNRPQEQNASNSTIQPKPTNWTLIIVLSIAGIAIITGLIFYLLRKKTKSN